MLYWGGSLEHIWNEGTNDSVILAEKMCVCASLRVVLIVLRQMGRRNLFVDLICVVQRHAVNISSKPEDLGSCEPIVNT